MRLIRAKSADAVSVSFASVVIPRPDEIFAALSFQYRPTDQVNPQSR
jgi:hypothetical protein